MPDSDRSALYRCHAHSLLGRVIDKIASDADRLVSEDRALRREAPRCPASAWRAGVGGGELFLAVAPGHRS